MASSAAHDDPTRPLAGRPALVTGASRGIGRACANRLASLGADLTLVARDASVLEAAAGEIEKDHGVRVVSIAADACDEAAAPRALDACREALGAPQILVNNVGGARSAPFHRSDDALFTELWQRNVLSTARFSREALGGMREAGFGRIVNVASTAGLKGYRYVVAYCAAKHGLVGLTRALALELANTPITVNAVCPGFVDSDMTQESIENIARTTGRSEAEARAELEATNPQRRLIQPEEVASAVAWLCLPGQLGITGEALPIAGGELS